MNACASLRRVSNLSCLRCCHCCHVCCCLPHTYTAASAYDPIADANVPSAKSAVKPAANGAGRKMLQQQMGLFGPVYTGAPFW
jgi:hypothetical protein